MRFDASRRLLISSIGAMAVLALAGCKIVPNAGEGATAGGAFDAKAYAAGLWAEKVLPYLTSTAYPLPEILVAVAQDLAVAGQTAGYRPATEGSPWTFIVSGTGAVTKKNTASRAGTLTVALDGTAPPAEIAIQIGPVVRGNAVRDSLPFVSFKDFTNQLEFADVGKAFTALAVEAISADAAAIAEGQKISFVGAMSLNSKTDKIVVTPVSLKVTG